MIPNNRIPKVDHISSEDSNDSTTLKNTDPESIQNNRKRIASDTIPPKPLKSSKLLIIKQPITTNQMLRSAEPSTSHYTSSTLSQIVQDQQFINNEHTSSMGQHRAMVRQIQSVNTQKIGTSIINQTLPLMFALKNKQYSNQQSEKPSDPSQDAVNKLKNYYDSFTSGTSSSNSVPDVRTETLETRSNKIEDDVCVISSDEEDDENQTSIFEPMITRTESIKDIKIYIDILKSNAKLFEDKLLKIDVEDYFKIKQCHSIQIGTYKTTPVNSEVLISIYGIRMTVYNSDSIPVTIDVKIDNILKILGYYGESGPIIFIYTNYMAAVGIKYLLDLKENGISYHFDPFKNIWNKIVCPFNATKSELQQLEKLMLKLPHASLTVKEKNKIYKVEKNIKIKDEDIDNITICGDKIDDRIVTPIKIFDYKKLNYDKYMNDSIMEFYLNRKLSIEDKNRTHLFSTFFYTALTKDINSQEEFKSKLRHDRVKNWTKNVNIFEKDFIFIPINKNFHWFMAVICFPYQTGPLNMEDNTELKTFSDNYDPIPTDHTNFEHEADKCKEDLRYYHIDFKVKNGVHYKQDVDTWKSYNPIAVKQPCILLLDSLYCSDSAPTIVANIREWIGEEYQAKHNGLKRDFSIHKMKGHAVKVPQQPNLIDCGLYVMHFFEMFFKSPIVDFKCPIIHLENWFHIDDVAKGKKRKEVQFSILMMMKEQCHTLPQGVSLPSVQLTVDDPQSTTSRYKLNNYGETYYHNNYERFDRETESSEEENLNLEEDDETDYHDENSEEGNVNFEEDDKTDYCDENYESLEKETESSEEENLNLEEDDETDYHDKNSEEGNVNFEKDDKTDYCDENYESLEKETENSEQKNINLQEDDQIYYHYEDIDSLEEKIEIIEVFPNDSDNSTENIEYEELNSNL